MAKSPQQDAWLTALQAILAFLFGIGFCVVLAYAALREKPITDPGQFFLL